ESVFQVTTVAAIPLLTEVRRFLAAFYAFYLIEFKDDAALFPASWIDGQIVSSQAAFSVRLDFILWDEQDGHAEQ
ncbi:hypothetical protein, partial [uncultured Mitsuokella sp.]|uniref:hypothetical protein n=1 Tax=uncultured Mitsuokella sp. TaxID=453120 RepID=UPI002593F2C3